MALFDPNKNLSLEQILGDQAKNKIAGIEDTGVQNKRRLVAQEAHSGRLMSGVSDYPLGDLAAGQAGAESDVYSGLAGALGGIPAEDYLDTNQNDRNLRLAKLIGSLNKPSSLEEALGGLGQAGQIGAEFAAFA